MLFDPLNISGLDVKNRIVLPPMCMYLATPDGMPTAFHLQHYLSRAIAGVGIIIQEATAIESGGRITDHDLGLWNDEQIQALKPIVQEVQKTGAKMFVQLAHAGRKTQVVQDHPFSVSHVAYSSHYQNPVEMTLQDISNFRFQMREAAKRALEAGYDGIEIHAAHGYLINSFLSPTTNLRTDEYGGSLGNRRRLLKEVLEDILEFYPEKKSLGIRISAEDYVQGGMHVQEMAELLEPMTPLLDFVHVSSGGVDSLQDIRVFPLYQVGFSAYLKAQLGIPTIAVGKITTSEEAEYILQSGMADMIAFGRILLRDPFFLARENPALIENYDSYQRGIKE